MALMVCFLFLIGIFLGSFLNVVIDRLPRSETIIRGRSHCEFCHHVLQWYDLLPFISFVFLKGKCRYCKKFIGWKYPLIEFLTGCIFAGSFFMLQNPLQYFLLVGTLCLLEIIFFTDLFSGIIPDNVVALLALFAIIRVLLNGNIFFSLITALATGFFFFLLFLFTKGRGMGFGDVKYSLVMGLLLGFPFIIPGLYVAFLTGTVIALILLVLRKKTLKSSVPFGPFLVIGTMSTLLFGDRLWTLFLRIMGI